MFAIPKKLYLAGIILVFLTLWTEEQSSADSDGTRGDALFLAGYNSYLNDKYAACSDYFYLATEAGVSLDHRAHLYASYCQLKLGLRSLAAGNLAKVDRESLSRSDKALYRRLSRTLAADMLAFGLQTWVALYGGALTYNLTSYNSSSTGPYYGLYTDFSQANWELTLGAQNMTFSTSTGSNLNLFTGLVGFQDYLSPTLATWIKAIYIAGSTTNFASVPIAGIGLSWYSLYPIVLKANYFYSLYSKISFGPLALSELTATLTWVISDSDKKTWSLEVGSESIFPTSPNTQDSSTSFTLAKFYERYFTSLKFKFKEAELSVGGWDGHEAFGIRNEGFVVYSALEDHYYGWNAGIKFTPESSWSLQLLFLEENIIVSGYGANTYTYFGSLSFKL